MTRFKKHSHDWEAYARYAWEAGKVGKRIHNAYNQYNANSSRPKRRRTDTLVNKQSNPSYGVIRQQAGKATRKVTGRKKTKSIVHRKKNVKVGRVLRKKIKKVIAGQEIKGMYTSTRQGTIGFTSRNDPAVEYRSVTRAGGYNLSYSSTKVPTIAGANVRFWWSHPYSAKDAFTIGDEWQFFTPMKVLDAASVLWNQKTISQDYTTQAGNLNTVRSYTTGAEYNPTTLAMNVKGLKVHIMNAYVSMVIKNNTQRSMNIIVYKCVPTTKFPNRLALEAFVDAITFEIDNVTGNTGLCAITGPLADDIDNCVIMPGVEPNHFKTFKSMWKYTKVKINLSAGEATTLNFQGPRNYVLDYDKLKQGEDDQAHLAYKQTSMNVMMSVSPDLEWADDQENSYSHTTGRWWQNILAENKISNPISVEWKEVYNLALPEIVGFQSGAAATAGGKQTLNMRIPRRAYGNFCDGADATTAPEYVAHNEDNVAVPMPQSVYE